MSKVTLPSIAYVVTQVGYFATCVTSESLTLVNQVQFSLSLSPVFSRTDTVTDSEKFYNLIIELCDDPKEHEEINKLLTWWNWYVGIDLTKLGLC